MKKLSRLIPLLALFSCATEKRCTEKFPSTSTVKDSIITKVEVKYKDTTLYLSGEEITIREQIPCPDFVLEKKVKKNHLTASLKINNGVVEFDCAEDSLMSVNASLKQTLIEVNNNHIKESQKPPIIISEVKWYHKFGLWNWLITWLIFAVAIIIKIYKLKWGLRGN